MKRRVCALLLTGPAALCLTLAVTTSPASATSANANCVGKGASFLNHIDPSWGGEIVSFIAHENGGHLQDSC
jgi:hypothetical protein